jgi:hypothetical protein
VIAHDVRPRQSPRIAARVVDGKALIVVIDHKQLHTLNEVGTRVWELCDGRSVAAIAQALQAEFAVDEATALRDVQQFVQQLQAIGALDLEAA